VGDESFDIFKEQKASLFPTPRPFQDKAHEMLRDGYKHGHKNQLICAPTGAGKTVLSLRIINEALKKNKRAVFICDRKTLINQTSETADRYGMDHGIIQADHWRRKPESNFQIASIQTLMRRKWPGFDVAVVDECFVEDTMISTPSGDVPIQFVRPGHTVYNATGIGVVTGTTSQIVGRVIRIGLSNGKAIRVTESHRFFTSRGWLQARFLVAGALLYDKEAVRSMWGRLPPVHLFGEKYGRGGDAFQQENVLLKILCEEIEKSNAQSGIKGEDGEDVEKYWSQAISSWREWYGSNCDSGVGAGASWVRMEGRGSGKDGQEACGRIPPSLQDRYSERRTDDCAGVGRRESRGHGAQGHGCEEGCPSEGVRVESVALEEQPGGTRVFNIGVTNHPSYFAGGVLAHNCHVQMKSWVDFAMDKSIKTAVIGLTATPFSKGLGKIFTNAIMAATMHELTQQGILVPMRVFSCTKPDMAGAETAGGEWTDKAAEERELRIVGDVVTEWVKFAENRKTIVFGSTIAHCEEICRQFNEAGICAAVYTSNTTDDERAEILDEYKQFDSPLRILVSVEALARGFDVPAVSCLCDARPLRKSFSTVIQMWGRALRSSPETLKSNAYLLDFSGNVHRFAESFEHFYFNGIDKLDDGEKLDKEVRKDDPKEERKCPQCGHIPFVKRCASCGFERVSLSLVEHLPGEMREITIGKKKAAESPEHLWAQIATFSRSHGKPETASARAYYLYRDIMGTSPPRHFDMSVPAVEVSAAVIGKIRSRQIAHAKGMEKRRA